MVVVDGLGVAAVEELGSSCLLRSNLATELSSVFPSSTPVALTSLLTGLWPCAHGIPGNHSYLEEMGEMCNVLDFANADSGEPLSARGISFNAIWPFCSLRESTDVRERLWVYPSFACTAPFTRHLNGGVQCVPYDYEDLGAVERIATAFHQEYDPALLIAYVPQYDMIAHRYGWRSEEARHVLSLIDKMITRLACDVPESVRVVAVSDHGQCETRDGASWQSVDPSVLATLAAAPFGDPRGVQFRVRSGRRDEFESAFSMSHGRDFACLDMEQAFDIGLFGPPEDVTWIARKRFGDYVAVPYGYAAMSTEHFGDRSYVGHHGGMLREEVRVPLVIA